MEISKQERKILIAKISRASGIAQYAIDAKMSNQQILEANNNLDILLLVKDANNYNRHCQKEKTAEANAKFKQFIDLQNSEIYKAGQWLLNCLSKNGDDRKKNLLEKDLVYKSDYNEATSNLRDTIKEQQKGVQEQNKTALETIQFLENKNDSLRKQLQFIKDYLTNNYGQKEWGKLANYIQYREDGTVDEKN